MDNTSNASFTISSLVGWLFGLLALLIGVVNTFWGNDPGFGIFIIVLSLAFFPPVNSFIKEKTGFSIPRIVKWLLGFFILWASLGVGELFDKIDLMMASF
ncbi:hypothetical protein [Hymenobacter qilianensis]|nr:hypothetical protein [Hymenobacter qilianensis]QNP53508.1 hypothetical protein H9L05_08060 [Hymenobacter qilianensis]